MKKQLIKYPLLLTLFFLQAGFSANAQSPFQPYGYAKEMQVNYVRVLEAAAPETDSAQFAGKTTRDVKQSTQYVDGLGRPLQTVVKEGSMATGGTAADLVNALTYDEMSREKYKYLPFVANDAGNNTSLTDGGFKGNPFQQQASFYADPNGVLKNQGETYYYSQTNFEASPLNRVNESFAPGNSWAGTQAQAAEANRRSIKMKYWTNTAIDDVRIWTVTNSTVVGQFGTYSSPGAYAAGELLKNVTLDEHNNQVLEFKDKQGKLILKKVQQGATPDNGNGSTYEGWLCTYYIYDDFNNLSAVLPPLFVEEIKGNWSLLDESALLDELSFRYKYDRRNRMIMKQVPGAKPVFMVYDARDRLVMMQDANLRSKGKWLVTKYDVLNRPVETGLWENTSSFSVHLVEAIKGINYPETTSGYYLLTETHYDHYNGMNGLPIPDQYDTQWDNHFSATDEVHFPYPIMPIANYAVKGQVTWTKTAVPGSTGLYLYAVNFYDGKGRVIQTISNNSVDGITASTSQYSWIGQPLVSLLYQTNKHNTSIANTIRSTYVYDELGRPTETYKRVITAVNGNEVQADRLTTRLEYDELGRLKNKNLSPDNNLETLTHEYNIRGWLLGVNRAFARDENMVTPGPGNYFGFDLGYDKTENNLVNNTHYNLPQFNGNISGSVWKSAGDSKLRKYDYQYDPVNRLTGAAFGQYVNGGHFTLDDNVDYSVSAISYDANGNILTMKQKGLQLTGSNMIDDLIYKYLPGTNKLESVDEATLGNTNNHLGDFTDGNDTEDYDYDENGNLTLDKNKNIADISYNHLNLPATITVTGKGTIDYLYDAGGNKLRKTVTENNVPVTHNGQSYTSNITTITDYVSGILYESKTYSASALASLNYQSRLQLLPHEEGRIRYIENDPNVGNGPSLKFDYFVKDHLGNVRMLLTDDVAPPSIYQASMETAASDFETKLFNNIPETRANKPGGFDADAANEKTSKLFSSTGTDKRLGPGVVLKVMAGDKFTAKVFGWYQPGTDATVNSNGLPPLINLLLSSLENGIGGIGKVTAAQLNTAGVLNAPLNQFLPSQPPTGTNVPKAYLNWVLLDEEQLKLVTANGNSGAIPIPAISGTMQKQLMAANGGNEISVAKNGYLYVYVSNESQGNVYFDDLRVEHVAGPILEETHYYPFGLIMQGISSRAAGSLENKRKWNKGSELESKEFSDGSGLELYSTFYRSLDPQLGRFWQIDPKPNHAQSLYSAMNNNPISFNDPLGDTVRIRHRGKDIIYNNGVLTNQDGSAYSGKVKGFLKKTVNALNAGRTGSAEAASMITELQGSTNNFTIVKGNTNKFDYNPAQRLAGYANQIRTDPAQAGLLATTTPAQLAGGAGGTITWNPSGANVWVVGGGQNNNPTTNLMHELFHGRDANRGLIDDRDHNGIDRSEWQASYKENIVRQQMGLPIREYYRSQDNAGTITPLAPRLLDAANNPILPTWLPVGW